MVCTLGLLQQLRRQLVWDSDAVSVCMQQVWVRVSRDHPLTALLHPSPSILTPGLPPPLPLPSLLIYTGRGV